MSAFADEALSAELERDYDKAVTEFEHIKQLAGNLTPAKKEILAHYLVEANGQEPSSEKPKSLRGDWADAFSQNLDIDAELKDIRGESQKEWHEDEFVG